MIIETPIEYDALKSLGHLLKKLEIVSGAQFARALVREFGDEFEECDYCNHPHCNCTCNPEYHNDRYDIYNDEASFD